MVRAAVMGAGSWGTTMAKVFADAGTEVTLWARNRDVAHAISSERTNTRYLPGVTLPASLTVTADYGEALRGADLVVLAVPSQSLRANVASWLDAIEPDATLLSLAKGIESGTLLRMSEVIAQVCGVEPGRIAVLSGPNLAAEIADEQPAATVIACSDEARAEAIQRGCLTSYFRPYTNVDVVGCEIGGACKNVIALACGIAAGLGYGENTIAALITRGLAETIRLAMALGANPATLAGLAGVGDLVATCSSPRSRNRTFGEHLAHGGSLESAQAAVGGQVAEGVKSCTSMRALAAHHGVEVPIADAVHRVCHDGLPVAEVAGLLLGRTAKPE